MTNAATTSTLLSEQSNIALLGEASYEFLIFLDRLESDFKTGVDTAARRHGNSVIANVDSLDSMTVLPSSAIILHNNQLAISQELKRLYIKSGSTWIEEKIGKPVFRYLYILALNKRTGGIGKMQNKDIAKVMANYLKNSDGRSSTSDTYQKIKTLQEKYGFTPLVIREEGGKGKHSITTFRLNSDLDGFNSFILDSEKL